MSDSMKMSRNGKKKKIFTKDMQGKLAFAVLVITLALFALVIVLYNQIKEKNEEYTRIVLKQHSSYDSRTLAYRRGDIVDRNGTYLATSERVYNLILDPNQISKDSEKYLEPTVSALCEVFGYDRQEVLNVFNSNPDSYYVKYATQLSVEDKEAFETKKSEMNKQYSDEGKKLRVKGVWFEEEYRRFYPYGSLACNVVGFSFDKGKQGSGGIEQYYNDDLIGTDGREYGYLDNESNMECVIKPAENGNTIVSTIDANIQKIAEKYIDEWMNGIGSQTAAVLIMNPNNGEILAMASNRKFDLNDPRNLNVMYSQEEINSMTEAEKTDAWNKMWRNFCISDSFEPGSPAKPLTVASCLEEGVISPQETFVCDGGQDVGGYRIKCVSIYGHGILNVEQSLMKSCNDVMMQIASRLGIQKFIKYQKLFGMGQKTGIDLPGEADASALVFNENTMGPTDLACNSFGQTYNCTMIQMAAAFCSLINGGNYYTPHTVRQILDENGSIIENNEPELVRKTISKTTSDLMKQYMAGVVTEGTGSRAAVDGYTIGGKTGTAEKIPRNQGNYVLSFIGFSPVENPQIMLYVAVDEPNVESQSTSGAGALLFHAIMEDLLPYMNVYQSSDEDVTYNGKDEPISSPFEGNVEDSTGEGTTEEGSTAEGDTTAEDTGSENVTSEGTTEAVSENGTSEETTSEETTEAKVQDE